MNKSNRKKSEKKRFGLAFSTTKTSRKRYHWKICSMVTVYIQIRW